MMEIEKPKILLEEQENGARAVITVEPLEKGFGITIGNMLRRTLLSPIFFNRADDYELDIYRRYEKHLKQWGNK